MKIALGCDHRGGKVAFRLTKDVFLRDHYAESAFEEAPTNEQMIGAFMIEGATVSDDSNAQGVPEEAKVYPIKYSAGKQSTEEIEAANETASPVCVDYPDVAAAVAEAVSQGRADKGVLICGTGIGMCITANKFRGIRAAVCFNEIAAELSRRHNDANVLCISAEFLSEPALENLVRIWLDTPFDGGRHAPRVGKISECETQTGL